jgi:hypothetical protein
LDRVGGRGCVGVRCKLWIRRNGGLARRRLFLSYRTKFVSAGSSLVVYVEECCAFWYDVSWPRHYESLAMGYLSIYDALVGHCQSDYWHRRANSLLTLWISLPRVARTLPSSQAFVRCCRVTSPHGLRSAPTRFLKKSKHLYHDGLVGIVYKAPWTLHNQGPSASIPQVPALKILHFPVRMCFKEANLVGRETYTL